MGKSQPFGPRIGPGTAHTKHRAVFQGTLHAAPAVGKAFEDVVLCLHLQHLTHLQNIRTHGIIGKKSNQSRCVQTTLLQHPKIVREGVVQAHDFQVGDLFHDPAGPFAGDNDFGTRSCQRLCTLDRLLAAAGGHHYINVLIILLFDQHLSFFRQL